MGVQVVWLKRDLRISDHRPLAEAARQGPVLCLYVYEPELWSAPESDASHLVFVNESLAELEDALAGLGARVTYRVGAMPDVLERLAEELAPAGGIAGLWSHEETGLGITYARDKRVARWCRRAGIRWTEIPQHGVFRPLATRDGWAERWEERMEPPPLDPPARIDGIDGRASGFDHGARRDAKALGLEPSAKTEVQRGGEKLAHETLRSFLDHRGVDYRGAMSSPVEGWDGCSRLSTYLAWGCLSMRQAYHAARERARELKALPRGERDPRWLPSLQSFFARLRWHCHFIQKLESEPEIEFHNMNRAYDGLREDDFDEARFVAWTEGRTGYPMVDASMRCLHRTGWVNFRMRAMLVSFASYHLWLHWRPTAVYLARHFLDFEPGIHFSQFQMQSGVTGINAVRIYSPAKQVLDQDPEGVFIRKFVPELTRVPKGHLAEPHRMPGDVQQAAGCVIGRDYPLPIVEHAAAVREAKRRIYAVRNSDEARAEAEAVYLKHGSRRRPTSRRGKTSSRRKTARSDKTSSREDSTRGKRTARSAKASSRRASAPDRKRS